MTFSWTVLVPLRKGHKGLEYKCSFVPVFSAFLIICIETLVFVDCFVTLPPGFGKTGPQSYIQVSCGCEERQSSRNYLQNFKYTTVVKYSS